MANKIKHRSQKGYTVIQNTVLKNETLTLKETGMLCKLLSLPEDWEFSIEGFAKIMPDGKAAIRSAVQGLEEKGYVRRVQSKDENNKYNGYDWEIADTPIFLTTPSADFRTTENETTENETTDNQTSENQRQLNNHSLNNDLSTVSLTNQSNLNLSALRGRDEMRQALREKTEIDYLLEGTTNRAARDVQSEIYSIYEEIMLSSKTYYVIAGDRVPTYELQQRLSKLHAEHFETISEAILSRTEPIVNTKAYITKCLFDAAVTSETALWNEIKRDGII